MTTTGGRQPHQQTPADSLTPAQPPTLARARAEAVQLLTTEQVARHLSVNVTTVRRWIAEGRLPATQVGRGWRVHPADLRGVLRANMRHSSALVTGPGGVA